MTDCPQDRTRRVELPPCSAPVVRALPAAAPAAAVPPPRQGSAARPLPLTPIAPPTLGGPKRRGKRSWAEQAIRGRLKHVQDP